MPNEFLFPNTLIFKGLIWDERNKLAQLLDDPNNHASDETSWISSNSSQVESERKVIVGFPASSGNLVGTQIIRFSAKKNNGHGTHTIKCSVYEGSTLLTQVTTTLTSSHETKMIEVEFDASKLFNKTGSGIRGEFLTSQTISTVPMIGNLYWFVDPLAMQAEYNYGGTEDTPPFVAIEEISKMKISDEDGMNQSIISFSFDQDVTEWKVMVNGTSWDTGTVADSGFSGTANQTITATIDWTELYQEGSNRINIYGKNSGGSWTPYEG